MRFDLKGFLTYVESEKNKRRDTPNCMTLHTIEGYIKKKKMPNEKHMILIGRHAEYCKYCDMALMQLCLTAGSYDVYEEESVA
jgi:hypothetical protein